MNLNYLKKDIKIKYTMFQVLFYLHTGIIGAVYVLYLLSTGLSLFQANFVSSIFSIALIIFEVPSGALCDAIGKRKTAILAGVFLFLSMVLFFIGGSIYLIVLGQIFWGISYALESGTIESWAINKAQFKEQELDEVFAFSNKILSFFMIVGSFIGSYIADYSLNYIWLLPTIFSFIFILFVIKYVKEDTGNVNYQKNNNSFLTIYQHFLENIKNGIRIVQRDNKVFSIFTFGIIMSFISSPLMTFWSVYLKQIHNEDSFMVLSMVWMFIQIAIIFGNHTLEYLAKRFERKFIIIISLVFYGVSILFMQYFVSFSVVLIMILIQEMMWAILSTTHKGLVNVFIDDSTRATMISFSQLFSSIGRIGASLVFGYIAETYSIQSAWLLSGILSFLAILYIHRMYKLL